MERLIIWKKIVTLLVSKEPASWPISVYGCGFVRTIYRLILEIASFTSM